uniref:Uncharacterized protein n=1 Tax=Chromera velia CCMP2878 TaxID=1169474 RepID=A0A0G4HLL3_9ALVE|eukprot:Cvel_7359.t1-p1 / transcript=Cvel_7359.t1 / gene=Cvel_7359 / organism=Chromera_velia_CCMP2878 / gene_product=hypothetical protein / transcript_product=hypothetical protein / location=Cvel_scaffold382:34109-39843(-) / protein_length=274 / sequence_SO=supercontig / SO=protein_coding / is_pseudo=false
MTNKKLVLGILRGRRDDDFLFHGMFNPLQASDEAAEWESLFEFKWQCTMDLDIWPLPEREETRLEGSKDKIWKQANFSHMGCCSVGTSRRTDAGRQPHKQCKQLDPEEQSEERKKKAREKEMMEQEVGETKILEEMKKEGHDILSFFSDLSNLLNSEYSRAFGASVGVFLRTMLFQACKDGRILEAAITATIPSGLHFLSCLSSVSPLDAAAFVYEKSFQRAFSMYDYVHAGGGGAQMPGELYVHHNEGGRLNALAVAFITSEKHKTALTVCQR